MKIRVASLLLALALPLSAQDPAAEQTEAIFYKAYYLEKGQRDFAGAMALYEQFLAKAPDSKLAAAAAKQQYKLLDDTGKTKERDAFKAKYEKLLGNVANAPAAGAGAGAPPARGDGEGRPGGAGRPDAQARAAELEKLQKELDKAKADGNAEEVKKLEAQIERAKQGGRGPGAGGQAGGGRRGGLMAAMMSNKKISEMTAEEVTQLKDSLGNSQRMIDGMKQNGQEEQAKKLEAGIETLKKALEANKTEDAQKALDALKEVMPQRRRGGGGNGGGAGNGGGNNGGGGGTNGGGGSTGNGGGGSTGNGGGGGR
jgi:tetratricopeptide (TPR) repeat protein